MSKEFITKEINGIGSNDRIEYQGVEYRVIDLDFMEDKLVVTHKGECIISRTVIDRIVKKIKRKNIKEFIENNFEDIHDVIHFSYEDQSKEGIIDSSVKKEDLMSFIEKYPILKEINVTLDKRKLTTTKTIKNVVKLINAYEKDILIIKKYVRQDENTQLISDIQDLDLLGSDESSLVSVKKSKKQKKLYRPPSPRITNMEYITEDNLVKFYIEEVKPDKEETLNSYKKLSKKDKIELLFDYRYKSWKKEIGRINTEENKLNEN